MRRLQAVAIAAVLCVAGCAVRASGTTQLRAFKADSADVRIRTDALPGRAELAGDGRVRFATDIDRLCQSFATGKETISTVNHYEVSKWYFVYEGLFVATAVAGAVLLADDDSEVVPGALLAGIGGFGALMFGIMMPAFGTLDSPPNTGEPRPAGETTDVRCPPETHIAKLELATPWGAKTTAVPAPDGVAYLPVDWADERIAAQPDSQLASPWRITTDTGLAFVWNPSGAERTAARDYIAKTRDRVVAGSTPAVLEASIAVATVLLVGGSSDLVIRVENKGASTAVDVTVKTRSSIPQLHGLMLSFGKIQPGKSVVRSQQVSIPAGTPSTEPATVLLVVTQASGPAPAEVTQKVALVRSVCPAGKLTRAQYDEKRAKLKRSLDAGEMTTDDFDRFDAELLRCLE